MEPIIVRIYIGCEKDPLNKIARECEGWFIAVQDHDIRIYVRKCSRRIIRSLGKVIYFRKNLGILSIRSHILEDVIKEYSLISVLFDEGKLYIDLMIEKFEDLKKILKEIYEKGCSVKLIDQFRFDEYIPILSKRQKEVLIKAIEKGYFSYPRKVNLSKLSNDLGCSISTLHEHIRKIIERIMLNYYVRYIP
ncbi:MAG: helix-turn-helix domain-containing protein [Sulfolobales archaeon]